MSSIFGGSYAPDPIPAPVVEPGAFTFAAVGLDHGHIYGMSNGLLGAGATLKWVYDPDPAKVAAFAEKFPQVKVASSEDEVLDDADLKQGHAAWSRPTCAPTWSWMRSRWPAGTGACTTPGCTASFSSVALAPDSSVVDSARRRAFLQR